jgi:SMODS and SLOG-associating 2TM effector domain 1/Protein of unknown function (DUF4231)
MSVTQGTEQLNSAWSQQRVWSQTANRLKERIDRARGVGLALGITGAVLAVAADQCGGLSMPAGRALSAGAAVTIGVATLLQRQVSTEQVKNWTRARSASEGLKTEIYSYLAGGGAYTGPDPASRLRAETDSITQAVGDLRRHALGIEPDAKPIPAVTDVDSYIALRVNDQITNFYTKRAATYEGRIRRLRAAGYALGVVAIVLAALDAALLVGGVALWVPVVTTVGTSVGAYLAATRYDHLVIEYLRTAQHLQHLCSEYSAKPGNDAAAFIDACEATMSVENQGWMARWNALEQNEPQSATTG